MENLVFDYESATYMVATPKELHGSGHSVTLTEERIARIQAEIEVLDENIEAANDFGQDATHFLSRREYLVGVLNG